MYNGGMSLHTATHRYAPDRRTLPNGVIVETYGTAHAARQADAQTLLDEISWARSAIATTVRCGCKAYTRLAVVYRTVPPVVVIVPETHADPQLVELREQAGEPEITYGDDVVADILTASDDRDLEARCRECGRYEIDRAALVDDFHNGISTVRLRHR